MDAYLGGKLLRICCAFFEKGTEVLIRTVPYFGASSRLPYKGHE